MYYYKLTTVMLMSSFMIAAALQTFIVPHHILEGGMFGVVLLINYWLHLNFGMMLVVMSIPLYLIVLCIHLNYVYKNVAGLLLVSSWDYVLSHVHTPLSLPPLWSAWVGGLIIGTSIGISFRYKISTDSIDMLAHLFSERKKVNVGVVIFFIDMLILICGSLILTNRQLLLSLITVTMIGIMTMVLNRKQLKHQ